MSDKNTDWRAKYRAMMTDPDFAAKAAAAVDNTRKTNTELMNKSAEDYPALTVDQPSKQPLDLSRVPQMQEEQAARATIGDDSEDYGGVVELATKLYDEKRTERGQRAMQNMQQPANAFASPMATAINRAAETNKAADISKTYEAVISNPSLQQAVRLNANKALVKALEANPSMSQEEQQKLFNETIDKQLQKMGEGIDKYLRGKNELKGGGEYVLRSAIQNSLIGKAMQTAIQSASGSDGELAYQQQALADYDANKAKWWEQGLGIAGGLALDAPLMQGIGSAANATMGRATIWGLGKIGGKALQTSTLGRVVTGLSVSSGTLGGYNATSALANQLMEGRFDVGEIAASAGHGFMLGALTGAMSPWLRGVSAGMGKVGKVATMTGGLATEAGIFSGAELMEMENPYDLETMAQTFGKNVAVIGGLKVSNLPKTVKEYKQWYSEGKQSSFSDADYKLMADFAKANGYANDDAFTMSADGTYSRSVADRVTGNRTLLTMTRLQGGKEQNLAIEMYNDPNVPLSLKTKIAAKMNLPAPPPVLANGVRVEGNKAITYYTTSSGQQQVIEIKEFDRPRKARAYANEFSRTTARRNDLLQSEASVNVMMSQPMVVARLNEQAQRNGTTLADEKARMDAILQRAADGTITQEDIAYYRSIVEDDVTTTESIKKDIKDKYGVEIDEVLNKEGNFTTIEDEALAAYSNALRVIIERGNPTTERTATAAMAGIEDYVALNNLGIGRTSAILANPEQRAAIEQQTRSHYAAWLKYFDGRMSEDALAGKLGLDLNNSSDLQTFLNEQAYYKTKAADRIAYNTAEAAKQLLEQGNGGVRFLDDGRVKLKGVPYAVEVSEDIVARYEAAKQGSGEPLQRIANDALKDIIKQSETPAEPIAEEMPDVEQPMSEAEAVTQQMIDARLAEIDTDLQGIEADGVQRMTINDKPVAIIKGRIVADENGQVDKTKSSAEVAYMLLDENGRPMLNEQGKPIIEIGVKPSNVRVENIETWRSVDDYKASEERRIRENNRITDEAMRQVDEQTEVENQVPTEPKTADDLLAMCDGDKALALDVATDELAKAMQAKGKGASTTETIDINRRIRTYQQIVDRLSASEMPDAAAVEVEAEQKGEQAKAEPQVTEDMEFIYQGLDENHEGMEPMQTADGRYKWVGLQRGELTATMGERDAELLDGLAKKLGVAIIPIDVADSAVNGYYRDGNVYVNTNRGADWTMRWVAGHELLHDVAKKSPEAYDAYKQAVLDMWGEDYIKSQVKQIIEDYKASGKEIDREQALTELVNDFGGELFSSRDGLKILDNILKDQSSKGNTGFVNTIKQWWERLKEWFGGTPYASEVEKKLADAYKEAIANAEKFGKNFDAENNIVRNLKERPAEVTNDDLIANEGAEMSIVRDRNKIEELEGEELVPMLRTFQVLDGALYSPMATIQRGKKVHSVVEGDWWKADENADLAQVKVKGSSTEFYDKDDDRISKKDGKWVITIDGEDKPLSTDGDSLSYYFYLKKGEKGDVVTDDLYAAYNPYIHSSKSALNDQFKGAYLRPNLVLVEVLVPKSELDGTNRYKADYAKDGIGEVDWNSGTVIKQAVAAGHPGRKVALSRYAKIGRVFTNAEWANRINEELAPYKDKITLPFISFPPEVLRGLANKGYKIKPPTSKKAQPYYEAWLKGEEPTDPNGGGEPTDAEFSIKEDKEKQLDIINRTNPAPDDYHTWIRTTNDIKTLQEAVDEVKAEDPEYDLSSYPDVTDDVINKALQSGKVTVYSSYPIKEGVFVSPSKMQAKDYAGGGKVYSKQVSINDVAWINTDEGMFAPTEYSVKGKRADESVLDYAKRMSEETGKKNLLNGGSYFSGGGLLEEGLKGIVNPTIAVEFNQKVAGVYRNNFGEHIVTADVRNVDPASLVKNIDGPVAYFHASPVCKNFSKAKQSAEELPLDKATAQSTAEFISKVRPKIVTIENVKGYRDSESMKIILDELKKQGYNYDVDVYNAADYGAYTSRERLIVRAVRDWSLPAKPMVMLADDRPSGWLEAVADIIDTLPEKKGGVAKWMDERLMAMGIDYRNIDKPLYVFGSGYSKDRIGYAFADELVPTLRTKGGDVIVMPDGRVLKATPRVLARISGISDEYEMPKTDDLAHTIVGNGIPVQLTKAVMGSLIENVKSDLDAGNTEYSIIGKRGAANLDKRDETSIRVDNMITAEEMEKAGKDAKTIRMATGWERGADGKWRYEVKDLSMLPAEQWIGKRNKKLSDIVENADELFAAYPELANVKIKEGNGKTYGGMYSDGTITLDTYLAKLWMKLLPDSLPRANKFMNETLIHEIQHYIQEKEGFAAGGNEGMILNKDAISEIDALISDSNKLAVQYNDMIAKGVYEGREEIKEKIISLRAEANAIKKKNVIGAEGYRSLAGEVEARNAEFRSNMTDKERANTMLADTEDVAREDQIFLPDDLSDYSIKQPKDVEYEAKEQWRKDNAGAIASSFFADRRADKAAEVEQMKKRDIDALNQKYADYSIKIRGKEYRNDGYTQREDGTNVSIRALDAEEDGTHSKGNFIKAYKVAKKDFDLLASLGVIKNTEWHHTGTNFAKTDYYSWADSKKADGDVEYGELAEIDPNSMAEIYKTNKKEIGQLTDEYNNAKWGSLVKEREKLPTIEYITERYIRVSNPEKYSLSDWLTKEEKNSKSAEHEEISRGGEAYGTSYERRQMHEGIDYKYDKIAYDRKKEWAESHKDDIRRKYDEITARVEKYNAEILPLEDVFANDAKGKPLIKLLEMFGYSAEDAAKKIYHLQYQYYSDTIDERMAEASEKVRKEYDAKIESARGDFDKWLSKAVKDGKAEFIERVATKPEYFITTKEEMNGRYGWFEASSRYNLPRYYSGYKFKTKRMYDSYKKREEDIFKIELEQISKTQEASNNVYSEYLKASHAVREDLVEKPLVQGDYSIKGGNTPKKQADEVARLKQKIEQLSQEKDAIAEDGAKVKGIASEMTSFIKKNIPTENQGDMTRQQFESVLKQLESAVTKQDLEKPMQMVEYIGTNVARRALTRQMRDFVKNGFKALTPKGLAKPKTVDGVTSRVLGLVKTLYQSMNKNAFGSDLYKLQKQVREEKAKLEQFNTDNGGKYQDVVDKVNEILGKSGVDRYEELYKYFDEKQVAGDVDGDVLGYIGRMLPLLDSIELTKDQQKQAKANSAIATKEDLDQLRTSLEEKRDKGILSEEDKAVLDNMPLYEAMLNLHQQQLNIDGPGASSLAMQMKAKVAEIKEYGKKLDELDNKNSKTAIAYKTRIKEANNELQELFAARIVDQKAVNTNVAELLDNLKEIRDTGKSKLQEWSKAKQERATRLVKMANESFGKDARGYWTEINSKGKAKRDFINWMNNRKMQLLLSPAMSFEYMLGVMDPRYYTNDSPIYGQFIKGSEGLLKANDNFFEGTESYNNQVNDAIERFIGRNALTNLKEYFERGDRFATRTIPFEIKVDRNGVKEYITKKEEMTRGQAAKIYAWSRMADGMAKLKAHGVTDDTLKEVKAFIGEDYMNFIDWVEDEFFPRLRRERYNPVYKQMYGISMAENDHYFPFAIYQKDVRTEKELEAPDNDTLGGGVVGNLVERKRNNARLDFTAGSPDIFDMITDYGKKMEEWAAYAQVREDLKKVVNDKQFKQHCDMLGTQYYKRFLNAAKVASRLDSESTMHDMDNSAFNKAMKAFASGAISLRVSTALKQLLSAPAFMVHSLDPAFQKELVNTVTPIDVESAIKGLYQLGKGNTAEAKKLLLNENWLGHYNWCVENLPSFRERVALGGAGNPILEQGSWGKFANTVQSVGMLPNRLVDAFTCSVGAKAVFNYSFNKYKKLHSEKTAHNMAVTDAEIAFNSSQQSSNPVFLSPLQVSRNPLWRGIMNYKNAAIGYYRNGMKANVDLYRASKALFGNPKFVINGQEVGFDGNNKDAKSVAATAAVRSVMYNFVLNYIWKFGTIGIAGIPTAILLGKKDEDGNISYTEDEIKRAGADNFAWSLFDNATQGMPVISGFANAAKTGYDYGPIMIFNEINSYMKDIHNQGLLSTAVAQSLVDFGLQVGLGVNAEVYGQMYEGLQGIMSDRPLRPEDIMNIIASPRSAISGVTKERVGEYGRLRDYVNDRIASERQLGIDERMDITKVLTGKRALTEKSLNSYIDEYLESKIPGYREIANKPNESQQEELANAKKAANAKLSYAEKFNSSQSSGKNKKVSDDYHTNKSVKLFSKAVGIIRKMVAVGDYETAERIANEMERRVKRGYNPDGKTIEERLENVDVWDSTGTTEQRSADGYSTAFDRAIKGGFDGYFRR